MEPSRILDKSLYPLVICYIAMENMAIEIVNFPIKHGISHSYVKVYQRVNPQEISSQISNNQQQSQPNHG